MKNNIRKSELRILPPAAKFIKKIKDKKIKNLYFKAINDICENYQIGERKKEIYWAFGVTIFSITRLIMN